VRFSRAAPVVLAICLAVAIALTACAQPNAVDKALDRMDEALRDDLGRSRGRGGEGSDTSSDAMRYQTPDGVAESSMRVASYLGDAGLHPEPCAAVRPYSQALCLPRDFDRAIRVQVVFESRGAAGTNVDVSAKRHD
jgi:hypothetical protein